MSFECFSAENVAVPEELRHAAGVQLLTETLKAEFATKLNKELHCIKLACRWSHPQSPYSDLLGSLTTLGDVEALSYQWQGHPGDKVHNADRMLRRVGFQFMFTRYAYAWLEFFMSCWNFDLVEPG